MSIHSKNRMFGCVFFFLWMFLNVKTENKKKQKLNVLICIWPDDSKNIIFHMKIQEYIFAYILRFNNLFIKNIKNLVFFIIS